MCVCVCVCVCVCACVCVCVHACVCWCIPTQLSLLRMCAYVFLYPCLFPAAYACMLSVFYTYAAALYTYLMLVCPQVIKIWTLYLKELLTKKPDVQEDEDSLLSPRHRPVEEPLLSPADKAEVVHMLTTICALREKHTKSLPPVMINIYQAMALLSLVLKDHGKVGVGVGVGVGIST